MKRFAEFELVVEVEDQDHGKEGMIRFQLRDAHGNHLAGQQVKITDHHLSQWQGIFDTRDYVARFAGNLIRQGQDKPVTAEQLLDDVGRFLGEGVLGAQIMDQLQGNAHRTLVVKLPQPQAGGLEAALAGVPWEMARTTAHPEPLMAQALVVRQEIDAGQAQTKADEPGELRVLLVFAEAPGSRPLAMRREREVLEELFFTRIFPDKRVVIDVLCYGVTRSRLTQQIRAEGGYDIIHWSGHGHRNLLELYPEPGQKPYLTGQELTDLFTRAGGYPPQLMFLSACLSGTVAKVTDWASFHAFMSGGSEGTKPGKERDLPELLDSLSGYTGTALELLKAGVPQVIAMRHSVGDNFAIELARRFYAHLLADPARHACETALALARGELLNDALLAPQFDAVDHATPVLFGQAQPAFPVKKGRSAQLERRWPRPQPLLAGGSHELDPAAVFVGRSIELTRLGTEWLPDKGSAAVQVQGLAGMGKTALAAEAIHLWHRHFDYVFCFQAKPVALALEDFYRQLDNKLTLESQPYGARVESSPFARIHLPADKKLTGAARFERLRDNLLAALKDERVLLVLDNFETNLETVANADGYRCQDPEWDRVLTMLARELKTTGSRLLVTSRHRLAALSSEALWLPLGPLPMPEAALYLRSHPDLRDLYYAGVASQKLMERLLAVSRGHPLILDRLAALAKDPAALGRALDTLEAQGGLASLPDVFAGAKSEAERQREHRYLEDVAIGAVDLLIQRASPDARRLLWIVTRAGEPVTVPLIAGVWAGRSVEEDKLEQIRSVIENLANLPQAMRTAIEEKLATPDGQKLLAAIHSLKTKPNVPPIQPLLDELHRAGLLAREEPPGADSQPAAGAHESQAVYSFHELVRERSAQWMTDHPDERGGRSEADVWVAYGERYADAFELIRNSGQPNAMAQATEAGRRALGYLVRARAFGQLSSFASGLIAGTRDPAVLRAVIGQLETVASQLPPGRNRWSMLAYLADALRQAGRADEALPFYESALAEAEAAKDWADAGWIGHNWANTLGDAGQLDAAKKAYLKSAQAEIKVGSPQANIVGSELEALRIDVMQGRAGAVLPDIEARLKQVRQWWERNRKGLPVPEAPNAIILGRLMLSTLDIARQAELNLKRWQACLDLVIEWEQVAKAMGQTELELARTRFNQYGPLINLDRLADAQRVVESCLETYKREDAVAPQARALSALANILDRRGDTARAVELERRSLAVTNQLSDPQERGISHFNLAYYLVKTGDPADSACHVVASYVYKSLSTGDLSNWLIFLAERIRKKAIQGGQYRLPEVAEVLARPDFADLDQFVKHRQADPARIQSQLDELVAKAMKEAVVKDK